MALTLTFFFKDSLEHEVEETDAVNKFTLTVVRLVGTARDVVVDWTARGNLQDVGPLSGQVSGKKRHLVSRARS